MTHTDSNVIDIFSRRLKGSDFLTVKEAAEALSVSTSTIYRRLHRLGIGFKMMITGRMIWAISRELLSLFTRATRKIMSTENSEIKSSLAAIPFERPLNSAGSDLSEIDDSIARSEKLLALSRTKRLFRANID